MEDKKASTNVFIIVLLIIIIGFSCYYGYDAITNKNNDASENKKEVENTDVNNEKKDNNKEVKSTNNYEYYYFEEEDSPDGSDNDDESFLIYKEIYLYNNGKFYYSYADYGDTCQPWYYGNYIIDDNVLKLTSIYRGDCDMCYHKDYLNNFEFKLNGKTLISSDNEILSLSKPKDMEPDLDFDNWKDGCKNN